MGHFQSPASGVTPRLCEEEFAELAKLQEDPEIFDVHFSPKPGSEWQQVAVETPDAVFSAIWHLFSAQTFEKPWKTNSDPPSTALGG